MKKLYIVTILSFLLFACQKENNLSDIGYLRLGVEVSTSTIESRAYNPKQWAVQIVNAKGTVVKETSNMDEDPDFKGQMELPVGTYTIKVSSAGFDNNSGFDKPYYAGSKEVTIVKDKEATPEIVCKLANVKVSVIFDDSFKNAFASAKVTVGAKSDASIDKLTFTMGEAEKYAYFPVTDLQAVVEVTNKSGEKHSQTNTFENVKAREHYILNYTVGDVGEGDFDVTIDNTSHTYTYTFNISTTPKTTLVADAVNAWSSFALFSGSATTKEGETLDASKMKFEYRLKDRTEWTGVSAVDDGDNHYSAKVKGLKPNTAYEYRMSYNEEEYNSETISFTTENAMELPNGSFDDWCSYKVGWFNTCWVPSNESDYVADTKDSFWDTGNPGASTGGANPTSPEETEVCTKGGKSAKLQSQFVGLGGSLGKFAAGNIYTGHYIETYTSGSFGAKIGFGREFTARPTQLTGWFKYSRGTTITHGDYNKDALEASGGDKCAIYIALTDNPGIVDNNGIRTAFQIDNHAEDNPSAYIYKSTLDLSENNPNVIAYGTITDEESKGTGEWQQFTVDLKYRDLTRKPKFIIVVASASIYGDYFTGSENSVMYIDDFSLVYGDEPVVQE